MMPAIVAPASTPAPRETRPIALEVRETAGLVRLDVVGRSTVPYAARFALEVIGHGPAGTNRTHQTGSATLRPGEPATLLSTALGGGGARRWTATLLVTPAAGAPYRRQATSPGS